MSESDPWPQSKSAEAYMMGARAAAMAGNPDQGVSETDIHQIAALMDTLGMAGDISHIQRRTIRMRKIR